MSQTIQCFVALDVHKNYVVVGAVDTRQEVVLHPRRVSLIRLDGWAKKHLKPTDAVVLEATSNAWHIHDLLEPLAARVVVANPYLVKFIAASFVKTDKRDALWAVAIESWARGSREHQLVALFILTRVKLAPAERWELGVRFLPDVSNWESCDQLCAALLGEALAKDPSYMDVIEDWVEDENLWVRRASLVATVYLRRAKYSKQVAFDLDRRTLAICDTLLNDREKYIRKAVDWSVREVIKRHYDLGREWLLAQADSKLSRTARSTLKLAAKKLTEHDQAFFLNSLGG